MNQSPYESEMIDIYVAVLNTPMLTDLLEAPPIYLHLTLVKFGWDSVYIGLKDVLM